MEIEIDSEKNNPLFNRTEVRFTIIHAGEGTPNREIIRSELAEKLNVKKENIIINNINSSFGVQQSVGYAKIYTSSKISQELERKYILKRNKVIGKQEKKKEEKKESEGKPELVKETQKEVKKPTEETSQKVEEPVEPKEDVKEEKLKEKTKLSEEKKE